MINKQMDPNVLAFVVSEMGSSTAAYAQLESWCLSVILSARSFSSSPFAVIAAATVVDSVSLSVAPFARLAVSSIRISMLLWLSYTPHVFPQFYDSSTMLQFQRRNINRNICGYVGFFLFALEMLCMDYCHGFLCLVDFIMLRHTDIQTNRHILWNRMKRQIVVSVTLL